MNMLKVVPFNKYGYTLSSKKKRRVQLTIPTLDQGESLNRHCILKRLIIAKILQKKKNHPVLWLVII